MRRTLILVTTAASLACLALGVYLHAYRPLSPSDVPPGQWLTRLPYLTSEKAEEMERIAKGAINGEFGCGTGQITISTSRGTIRADTWSDPIILFGSHVSAAQLITLLEAKVEANRTGQGPMSGDRAALCHVALHTLALARDPQSIDVIGKLINDDDQLVRGSAVVVLIRIGEAVPDSREKIGRLFQLHPGATTVARGRGETLPAWIAE